MDIILSMRSDKPLYEQLYEQISSQIVNGKIRGDELLPSIRTLAKDLSISIITVKKAWDMLEYNGFIYTKAGVGCFVRDCHPTYLEDKKFRIAEEQFTKEVGFYKSLGLSEAEFLELAKQIYQRN